MPINVRGTFQLQRIIGERVLQNLQHFSCFTVVSLLRCVNSVLRNVIPENKPGRHLGQENNIDFALITSVPQADARLHS